VIRRCAFCFYFALTKPLFADCCLWLLGTDHLTDGNKKDASFIASLFEPWIKKIDPNSTRVDCVFFDGASNVQKGGRILEAMFPRIHVQTCAAHSISLFFADLCNKLWQFRLIIAKYRQVYRLFGSGAMHSPYALFGAQSKAFNSGRKVCLIRAAETRMAGHAYAFCRMLRLREPLIATIGSAAYKDLKLKGFPKRVEEFLLDPDMWEAVYVVLRCLFPMIRCLRLGDEGSCGGMSYIFFYVRQTDEALKKSLPLLDSLNYFDKHEPEDADKVDEEDEQDEEEVSDDSSDDDSGDELMENSEDEDAMEAQEEFTLGEQILFFWKHRRQKLITPLAIAGWYCSAHPDVRRDVLECENDGTNRLEVEKVIAKMYFPIRDEDLGIKCTTFWTEFNQFQTKQGPGFSRAHIWDTDEIRNGNDYLWHKLYSVPFTKVFGAVACRVCSKPLGCGNAERNWGSLKQLKTGKRAHLSGDRAQKQATIFGAASMERARAKKEAEEFGGVLVETRWTDADLTFNLGLESWDGGMSVPDVVVPKRIFNAWIEDWEWELIKKKDIVAKTRLLQKYGGLHWLDADEDDKLIVGLDDEMEYQAGKTGSGWCVIGRNEDGTTESWDINLVIDEIAEYEQPPELNVEVIVNDEMREANRQRLASERAAKGKKKRH
jgi:hypothetical protein